MDLGEQTSQVYKGYRTTCTKCPKLTVSPAGSTSADDCEAAYTKLDKSQTNGYCDKSPDGMPLVPIFDESDCREAAQLLNLTITTAG